MYSRIYPRAYGVHASSLGARTLARDQSRHNTGLHAASAAAAATHTRTRTTTKRSGVRECVPHLTAKGIEKIKQIKLRERARYAHTHTYTRTRTRTHICTCCVHQAERYLCVHRESRAHSTRVRCACDLCARANCNRFWWVLYLYISFYKTIPCSRAGAHLRRPLARYICETRTAALRRRRQRQQQQQQQPPQQRPRQQQECAHACCAVRTLCVCVCYN